MENAKMITSKRYYDIDWLRVLGMLLVFFFHVARFFDDGGWHVKNYELDFGMSVFVQVLNHINMPLFFILSSFAIYYALKKRSKRQFLRERVTRLLVPLFAGIFTHIIIQVYIENLTTGRFEGTFWQFIPHYFDGWYSFGGNFAWMGLHLWYLLMIFIFSWLMLSTFQRISSSQQFTTRIADLVSRTYGPYLFIIPLYLVELLVGYFPDSIGRQDFGGWSPLTYLVFFTIGFILATDKRYRPAIQKVRGLSLALSLLTLAAAYTWRAVYELPALGPVYLVIRVANSWSWLLTFLGFASRYLSGSNRFLKYANQAVLPFYILHQTVIVVIGYFIKDWQWPVFPKYLFLAGTSFILIMVLYEFVVGRIRPVRYLFGMKA